MSENIIETPINPPRHIPWIQPGHMTVVLPWTQTVRYTDNGGAFPIKQERVYRLNSIWDPDWTGTGGNVPNGRDRWAKLYNYYHILGAKVTITFMPASINAFEPGDVTTPFNQSIFNTPVMVGAYMFTGNISVPGFTSWERIYESRQENKMTIMTGDSTAGVQRTLVFHWNPDTTIKTDIETQYEKQIWTPVGSDPAVSQLIVPFVDCVDPGTGYFDVIVNTKIEYTVQFTEEPRSLRIRNDDGTPI